MLALLGFILALLASPFKSRSQLEAENVALRQQLIVLRRQVGKRVRLTNGDRLFFVQLYRWFPSILKVITGAPRIHGELLKLGFAVAQSSVAKYMVKRQGRPGQGWNTFLRNHAPDIAAVDLFVVPTIRFDLLYAIVIVQLNRRELVWVNVTASPNADKIGCASRRKC